MDLNELEATIYYKDGELFWKDFVPRQKAHTKATRQGNRYKDLCVKGKRLKAHRVIFMLHHGWCPLILDHINGDRDDNRIENLRMSDYNSNNMNARGNRNTTSKYKGVSKDTRNPKNPWKAQIQYNKKKYAIGNYRTEEEAAKAYDDRAKTYFGQFAVLNFP
jgi:hypothetical protein